METPQNGSHIYQQNLHNCFTHSTCAGPSLGLFGTGLENASHYKDTHYSCLLLLEYYWCHFRIWLKSFKNGSVLPLACLLLSPDSAKQKKINRVLKGLNESYSSHPIPLGSRRCLGCGSEALILLALTLPTVLYFFFSLSPGSSL